MQFTKNCPVSALDGFQMKKLIIILFLWCAELGFVGEEQSGTFISFVCVAFYFKDLGFYEKKYLLIENPIYKL